MSTSVSDLRVGAPEWTSSRVSLSMMSRALRAHSPGSITALLPLLKSKFLPGKLRNGSLFGRSRQNVTFPLRLGDVLGARLSQRTCLGLRGAIVRLSLVVFHRALAWTMPDSRHKLRNAGQLFATNRETSIFAAKYA